jgi:Leucine-rich repeat (LRR) protein
MQRTYPKPKTAGSDNQEFNFQKLNGSCFGKKIFAKTQTLTITDCLLDDDILNILDYYPNLKSLTVSNSGRIKDLIPLANCHRLQSLILDRLIIDSLAGIEFCSELKSLSIYNVTMNDMTLLNGLGIEKLVLSEKTMDTFSCKKIETTFGKLPSDLPQLLYLKCQSASITSIPSYPILRELKCPGCSISDIAHLPKLEIADLEFNNLQNLDFLQGCPIEILNCRHNMITSIEPLRDSGIKNITCTNNYLTRLTCLPEVEEIICTDNKIFTLKDLEGSINLNFLECRRNRLINLSGLENMKELRTLDAVANDIFDINAIRNLDLIFINLEKNMIMYLPKSIFTKRKQYDFTGKCRYHFNKNLIEQLEDFTTDPRIVCDLTGNPFIPASMKRIDIRGKTWYLV